MPNKKSSKSSKSGTKRTSSTPSAATTAAATIAKASQAPTTVGTATSSQSRDRKQLQPPPPPQPPVLSQSSSRRAPPAPSTATSHNHHAHAPPSTSTTAGPFADADFWAKNARAKEYIMRMLVPGSKPWKLAERLELASGIWEALEEKYLADIDVEGLEDEDEYDDDEEYDDDDDYDDEDGHCHHHCHCHCHCHCHHDHDHEDDLDDEHAHDHGLDDEHDHEDEHEHQHDDDDDPEHDHDHDCEHNHHHHHHHHHHHDHDHDHHHHHHEHEEDGPSSAGLAAAAKDMENRKTTAQQQLDDLARYVSGESFYKYLEKSSKAFRENTILGNDPRFALPEGMSLGQLPPGMAQALKELLPNTPLPPRPAPPPLAKKNPDTTKPSESRESPTASTGDDVTTRKPQQLPVRTAPPPPPPPTATANTPARSPWKASPVVHTSYLSEAQALTFAGHDVDRKKRIQVAATKVLMQKLPTRDLRLLWAVLYGGENAPWPGSYSVAIPGVTTSTKSDHFKV